LAGEEISLPNIEHEKILASGVEEWNSWRERQLDGVLHREDAPRPNLSGANLQGRDLNGVNFSGVLLYRTDLRRANLQEADLTEADLQWADLRGADLMLARMDRVNLEHANLSDGATLTGAQLGQARLGRTILEGADLIGADLGGADLRHADLRGAILYDADLSLATLVGTRLEGAQLNGCRVYGASVWSVQLDEKTQQQGLIITPKPSLLPPEQAAKLQQDIERIVSEQGSLRPDWHRSETVAVIDEPTVTTDDLQIAQFLYLLRENKRLSGVIDAIVSRVVLVLGNFAPQPKTVLDAIRAELKKRDCVPVIFDFKRPSFRDTDETINMLARMARFIVADATDARSLPQELKGIVEALPSVPVQPIILAAQHEYGMFDHLKRYPWVLETFPYENPDHLLASLQEFVIAPAEKKVKEIRRQF
jgi:uncharacterized protein YjbI with pentapeptide repeats